MVRWWYGHNAVGFFLTDSFLGMMYYFVPKQAGQPVYSCRLSVVHFLAQSQVALGQVKQKRGDTFCSGFLAEQHLQLLIFPDLHAKQFVDVKLETVDFLLEFRRGIERYFTETRGL